MERRSKTKGAIHKLILRRVAWGLVPAKHGPEPVIKGGGGPNWKDATTMTATIAAIQVARAARSCRRPDDDALLS